MARGNRDRRRCPQHLSVANSWSNDRASRWGKSGRKNAALPRNVSVLVEGPRSIRKALPKGQESHSKDRGRYLIVRGNYSKVSRELPQALRELPPRSEGTTSSSEGTTSSSEGATSRSEGTTSSSEGTTSSSEGATSRSEGAISSSEGATASSGGATPRSEQAGTTGRPRRPGPQIPPFQQIPATVQRALHGLQQRFPVHQGLGKCDDSLLGGTSCDRSLHRWLSAL